jgi:hypothetical protein
LVGWLVGWLCWSVGFVGWLVGCFILLVGYVGWLDFIGWLCWLVGWLEVVCVIWLVGWLVSANRADVQNSQTS